jgi:hypothetical protein
MELETGWAQQKKCKRRSSPLWSCQHDLKITSGTKQLYFGSWNMKHCERRQPINKWKCTISMKFHLFLNQLRTAWLRIGQKSMDRNDQSWTVQKN